MRWMLELLFTVFTKIRGSPITLKVLRRDGLIDGVDFTRKKADEDGDNLDLRLEGNHVVKTQESRAS